MTLESTNRLITAVLVATTALVAATLAGRAEAALLAAPWTVMLILGLAGASRDRVRARLAVEADRVMVDGTVTVEAQVDGLDGGWVEAIWRPPSSFTDPPRRRGTEEDGEESRGEPIGSEAATGAGAGSEDGSEATTGTEATDAEPGWPGVAVGDVAGTDGTARLSCGLPARAWGSHDVGRVELRVHHRFGLTIGKGLARQPLPVRVHPNPIDLRRLLAPWHVRRLTGAHRSRTAARGIEYADIRAFGPGDSPRDINWRASARANELLVSQRHPDRSTHLILLIDSFADANLDFPAVLGESIEAAMALAESHLSASDRVGLIDLGGVIRWVTPGSGRHHLQRLVDALLATRLYHSEADRAVTIVPAPALPSRSFVLALSPLLDARFVDSLHILRAAGHDVALVELTPTIDDASPRWERTDVSALALRLWRAERDLQRDRLVEHGIAVAVREIDDRVDRRDRLEPWDETLHLLTTSRRRLGPLARS